MTTFQITAFSLIVFPFILSVFIFLLRKKEEETISHIAHFGSTLWLWGYVFLLYFFKNSPSAESIKWKWVLPIREYSFNIVILINKTSLVFWTLTVFLGTLIIKFCRYYLHKENGYARFFYTIFLFLGSMGVLSCAGSFEVFFGAWEILGVTSFLLIGFYRERLRTQYNAFKAFCVYRFCDIGLLLGGWLEHHLLPDLIGFQQLSTIPLSTLEQAGIIPVFILSFLILLAASGKSAQWPFSFWLPRALEGPTPSSAVFYGALSIHAGVLLLIRLQPVWYSFLMTRVLIGTLGLTTCAMAYLTSRVQSNIKARIGYSSISHVGIMFFELSMGWNSLALLHVVANATTRTFQLLISPSIISEVLKKQLSIKFKPFIREDFKNTWYEKLKISLYVFSNQEGYLEWLLESSFWKPLRKLSRFCNKIRNQINPYSFFTLGTLLLLGYWKAPAASYFLLQPIALLLFFILLLSSFYESQNIFKKWNDIILNSVFILIAFLLSGNIYLDEVLLYGISLLASGLMGHVALRKIVQNKKIDLYEFHGLSKIHEFYSHLLFFATLGIAGLPVTTLYIGEDLLLHYIVEDHFLLALTFSFGIALNGISALKIYSRLCLGPERAYSTTS